MKKKYDMSQIMTRAWSLYRKQDVKSDEMFSTCLKQSWTIAKTLPDFNVIYKKYYAIILNYIKMKLHNTEIAEELTNDVFVKFNLNITYNSEKSDINTYLYSIAKNCIIDYVRKEARERNNIKLSNTNPETGKEIFEPADTCKSDNYIINNELAISINKAISGLTTKYKRIAKLLFFDEYTYEEIAEALEIPMGTVKGMIYRLRKKLQPTLYKYAIS